MSYKLGLLLGSLFVMMTLLFGADIAMIDVAYQGLDALALTAGHLISVEGRLSEETIDFVESHGANIESLNDAGSSPSVGEAFAYRLYRDYQPMVLKNSPMQLSVTRSCVVGFYRS